MTLWIFLDVLACTARVAVDAIASRRGRLGRDDDDDDDGGDGPDRARARAVSRRARRVRGDV